MEQEIKTLQKTSLFQGFSPAEIEVLLHDLQAGHKTCEKGELLLLAGYNVQQIGILLAGTAEAMRQNPGSVEFTMVYLTAGSVFGDILVVSQTPSPVSLVASSPCTVLRIPYPFLQPEKGHSHLYRQLSENLLAEISLKYFSLDRRIALLLIRGLRQRISAYLLEESRGRSRFALPFGRQALARYLGCDRSALCRELSRMARDGLIVVSRREIGILSRTLLNNIAGGAAAL